MSISQIIMISLLAGVCSIDLYNGQLHIHRPLITGPVVGFILGDVTTGIIAGAIIELTWMAFVPISGAQPPNVVVGGILGTAFTILTKQEPSVAVSLSLPFAILGQIFTITYFTLSSIINPYVNKAVKMGDFKKFERLMYILLLIYFFINFILVYIPLFFGAEQSIVIVKMMPEWLIGGLSAIGTIMPACGFAMLLKTIFQKRYLPFFALGFITSAYLQLPILAIALIAVAIAGYDFMLNEDSFGKYHKSCLKTVSKLPKKAKYQMIVRSSFMQIGYNYERRQGNGWLYCMLPGLIEIYKGDNKSLIKSANEHVIYFSSHPFLVTFVQGVTISLEETKQKREIINSLKIAVMSPLGGIGDAFIWMTLLPITSSIAASIAMNGSIIGSIVFFLSFNIVHITLRYFLFQYGYQLGMNAADLLKQASDKISKAASIVGMMIVGSLIPTYVKFVLPIEIELEEVYINLQTDLLDQIMPGILSLGFTCFCYYLIVKRKASPTLLVCITIIIGILGGMLGIYKYIPAKF